MKYAILFSLLFIVSCSSFKDKFNDVKLEVAKKGKDFVTKELKSEYADIEDKDSFPAAVCDSEAEKIGLRVEEKLVDFLKAEQKEAAMVNKSLTASVLPAVCNFVASSVVPRVLEGVNTEYVCLKEVGSDKLVEIGKDLCDQIK